MRFFPQLLCVASTAAVPYTKQYLASLKLYTAGAFTYACRANTLWLCYFCSVRAPRPKTKFPSAQTQSCSSLCKKMSYSLYSTRCCIADTGTNSLFIITAQGSISLFSILHKYIWLNSVSSLWFCSILNFHVCSMTLLYLLPSPTGKLSPYPWWWVSRTHARTHFMIIYQCCSLDHLTRDKARSRPEHTKTR